VGAVRRLGQTTVIRYLAVGCSSYAIELSSLLFMINVLGLRAPLATAIAYWVGLVLVFGLQKLVAFKDYQREVKTLSKQGLLFGLLTAWNWLFCVAFVSSFGPEMIIFSRSTAQVIMAGWNYALYKNVIFRQPGQPNRLATFIKDPLLHWSIYLVTAWRALLEVLNQVVAHFINHQSVGLANINQWASGDGGWYLNVNHNGYLYTASQTPMQQNVAFFPAFPETTSVLAKVLHADYVPIGLILNFLLTIGCVFLLMKLAQFLAVQLGAGKHKTRIALISAITLLAYPASFFLAAYYADAMLLFGVLGSIYFAVTRRYWLAVPFMMLATASKVMGSVAVVVVAIIMLERWYKEKQPLRRLAQWWGIASLGLVGVSSFMIFLWAKYGDPILFYRIQQAWGRNDHAFFLTGIFNSYLHFFDLAYYHNPFYYLVNVVTMMMPFLVAAACYLTWRQYRLIWPSVLGFLVVAIPLSTGTIDSIYRYCLVAAPLIIFGAMWANAKLKPAFFYILMALSTLVMLFFAHGFLRGGVFAG
jgi:putative flippase GtrA